MTTSPVVSGRQGLIKEVSLFVTYSLVLEPPLCPTVQKGRLSITLD